jgi:hypothetical protein
MLVLYGTDHCHLCEQAAAMLHALDLPFAKVDIVEDEHLLARYGQSIPVLCDELARELCWPFNGEDVAEFLRPG